jgi:hypothetical protein
VVGTRGDPRPTHLRGAAKSDQLGAHRRQFRVCIRNRVYTGGADTDAYFAMCIPALPTRTRTLRFLAANLDAVESRLGSDAA